MTMSERPTCPQCGAELPANFASGHCPTCLLAAGLASGFSSDGNSGTTDATAASPHEPAPTQAAARSRARFTPPLPEELAARFPQLEILELLGQGGMGAVYKARHRSLDRLVALKILPPEVGSEPAFAERFTREARALARLNHPKIVAVHDFGSADGLYYLTMEYVPGVNLRQLLQAQNLKPADTLAIIPQICEALQFAHEEGIVHRDIKPENILIDTKGRVKIADFGLAKILGQDSNDSALTGTHQVMGTLRYMAPEQMESAREVDHRADIYSLGVVFYELLTRELPVGRFAPPSRKVEVDVRLDEIVLRALEQEPALRYQHISEVQTQLELVRRSPAAPEATTTTHPPEQAAPDSVVAARMTWIMLFALTVAELCLLGLTAGYVLDAAWYFEKHFPYQVLNSGLIVFSLGACLAFAYWWYLLAKDPQTPRSWPDLIKFWQTPDPRVRRLWGPLQIFFGVGILAVIVSFSFFSDSVQAIAIVSSFVIGPYFAIGVVWRIYKPGQAFGTATSTRTTNPWLTIVFAMVNLILSLALMIACVANDPVPFPADAPWIWRAWAQVETLIGFLTGALLFASSIGLLLWQAWARKLLLGLCFLGLVMLVVEIPFLVQGIAPLLYQDFLREVTDSIPTPQEEFEATMSVAIVFLLTIGLGLTLLIAELIYFTRPVVIAAFPAAPGSDLTYFNQSVLTKLWTALCVLLYLILWWPAFYVAGPEWTGLMGLFDRWVWPYAGTSECSVTLTPVEPTFRRLTITSRRAIERAGYNRGVSNWSGAGPAHERTQDLYEVRITQTDGREFGPLTIDGRKNFSWTYVDADDHAHVSPHPFDFAAAEEWIAELKPAPTNAEALNLQMRACVDLILTASGDYPGGGNFQGRAPVGYLEVLVGNAEIRATLNNTRYPFREHVGVCTSHFGPVIPIVYVGPLVMLAVWGIGALAVKRAMRPGLVQAA